MEQALRATQVLSCSKRYTSIVMQPNVSEFYLNVTNHLISNEYSMKDKRQKIIWRVVLLINCKA